MDKEEMVLGHSVCLSSADNLVYAREVIRSVARKHGFIATFVPNYDRIQPNMWTGAYQCWGKEAPLLTACPPGISDGLVSNFEIKCFDGCANLYLGLAAILAAGIDGLRRHLELPEPVDTNPSLLDGNLQRLPRSLSESMEALENDSVLDDLIGGNLCDAIKVVRKAEIKHYSKNKGDFQANDIPLLVVLTIEFMAPAGHMKFSKLRVNKQFLLKLKFGYCMSK